MGNTKIAHRFHTDIPLNKNHNIKVNVLQGLLITKDKDRKSVI